MERKKPKKAGLYLYSYGATDALELVHVIPENDGGVSIYADVNFKYRMIISADDNDASFYGPLEPEF